MVSATCRGKIFDFDDVVSDLVGGESGRFYGTARRCERRLCRYSEYVSEGRAARRDFEDSEVVWRLGGLMAMVVTKMAVMVLSWSIRIRLLGYHYAGCWWVVGGDEY